MAAMVIIDSQSNCMSTSFPVVYVDMAISHYSMAPNWVLKCQRVAFK